MVWALSLCVGHKFQLEGRGRELGWLKEIYCYSAALFTLGMQEIRGFPIAGSRVFADTFAISTGRPKTLKAKEINI